MECSKSSAQREIYSYKCLHLKRSRISNLTFQSKPKASRREEIIKIRGERNKPQKTESMQPKGGSLKRLIKLTFFDQEKKIQN